jgi:hypothetical protein
VDQFHQPEPPQTAQGAADGVVNPQPASLAGSAGRTCSADEMRAIAKPAAFS